MTTDQVLAPYRILELGDGIPVGFAGRNFAGFGAEVVKIESPRGGDSTRRLGPYPGDTPDPELSGLHLYLNQGKKSVTLDPSTVTGAKLLRELAGIADAVIENFSPGLLSSWGCGPDNLLETRQSLVVTSVTPYGSWGPKAGWKATNLTSFASGSQMAATGDLAREPLCTGGYQAEYQAGLNAFSATLLGLWVASRTGRGQHIDISAQECMASATEAVGPIARQAGELRRRQGQHRFAFVAINRCADGWAGIFGTNQQRRQIAAALAMPELEDDPRMQDMAGILAHDEELTPLVEQFMARHTKAELSAIAARTGLTMNPVATIAEVANSDHLAERAFFDSVPLPNGGTLRMPGTPFKSTTAAWRSARAPRLGEHTTEVLTGLLGLPLADVSALRASGIV